MKVSVVIPTYNGGNKLPALLDSLANQTRKPDEIIVVVDGSTDNTREILEYYESKLATLQVIYEENKGRSVVRNNGARFASGDLLVFFDDDMLPLPTCVEMHFNHHQKRNNTILTGSAVDVNGDKYSEFQNYKAWLGEKWIKPIKEWGERPLQKENIFLTAANFSISKQLFMALNGFDERLNDGEDFDLAFRANQKSIPMYYSHNTFAWHNDVVTLKKYIKRSRCYYAARLQLINLDPKTYGEHFKKSVPLFNGYKKLFFRLFCFNFWIYTADKGMLKFLPQKIRYKLYDWIITANAAYFPGLLHIKYLEKEE